jgi:peptide/nickel transport system permease protein
MIGYVIRRLIVALIVTIGVAAITFAILHYLQPSPASVVLGTKARPAAIASWNKQHGYDRPEVVQFWSYLKQLAQFKFGYSYKLNQTVNSLFAENAGRTAYLSGVSLVLALLIAIPLGIYQAIRRNSFADYSLSALNLTLYSMPSFFLGLILIQFLALDWNLLPPEVSSHVTSTWAAVTHPAQMTLPVATLTFITVASFSRYMRSSALDNLAQDYIRLARAKGLSERAVLFRHLLRNACLPMITLVGLSIPTLLAGNLLIEYQFNYPGLGLMFYTALGNSDYNILLAYVILTGMLTVVGNLIADIAITAADPRIRLG